MTIMCSEKKAEGLARILAEYGFNSQFMTDSFSAHYHLETIYDKAKGLDFELPSTEQRFFSLFHNLGKGDFDSAYLYDVSFNPVVFNGNPILKQITGLAIDLTRLLPANNLIIFYDNSRFAIPTLSLYNDGKLVRQSTDAGIEIYTEDYWEKDEEKYSKRAKIDFSGLLKLGVRSIP